LLREAQGFMYEAYASVLILSCALHVSIFERPVLCIVLLLCIIDFDGVDEHFFTLQYSVPK